ncbi:MAG TPA: hypothetical protein VE575_01125 [Acidimicrobiales bacterium]|jgi:hypothetical protein|nr:hypothetical protein [Acidimicrobiales bacterium]
MTTDDPAQHRLYARLGEVLGRDHAATLMTSLSDVTRLRHDFDQFRVDVDLRFTALEDRMDARFAAVDVRFRAVDHRFESVDHKLDAMEHRIIGTVHKLSRDQILAMVWANLGQLVAFGGLLLAAVRL